MATQNTYRRGRKVSHRGMTNNPVRREHEHRSARPSEKLTVDGKAKPHIGARPVKSRPTRTWGYYA